MKKNIVLSLLVMISPLMHAQEEKAAKPMISPEQMKVLIEEKEKKAKEFKSMVEQFRKEGLEREQLRHKLKPLWIALHTLQVSVGILLFYFANFYQIPTTDPNVMAQRAIPRPYAFSGSGIITFGVGLYGLYEELDIPGQVKKLMKLLKKEKQEKP